MQFINKNFLIKYNYTIIQKGNKTDLSTLNKYSNEEKINIILKKINLDSLYRIVLLSSQLSGRRIPSKENMIENVKQGLTFVFNENKNNVMHCTEYFNFIVNSKNNLTINVNINI